MFRLELAPRVRAPWSVPLSEGRFKVEFTASQALHDKFEQARHLLRHQVPNGDVAAISERALDLLLAELKKQRFGVGRKPRVRASAPLAKRRSRYVPMPIRREVYERDGGRCTFVSPDGRRCEQRGFLELDHVHAYGRGGATTTDNLRTRCKSHNLRSAEREYGRSFIQRRIAKSRARAAARRATRGRGTSEPMDSRHASATPDRDRPVRRARKFTSTGVSLRDRGAAERQAAPLVAAACGPRPTSLLEPRATGSSAEDPSGPDRVGLFEP